MKLLIGKLAFQLLFQILMYTCKSEQYLINIFGKYHFIQFKSRNFQKTVNLF